MLRGDVRKHRWVAGMYFLLLSSEKKLCTFLVYFRSELDFLYYEDSLVKSLNRASLDLKDYFVCIFIFVQKSIHRSTSSFKSCCSLLTHNGSWNECKTYSKLQFIPNPRNILVTILVYNMCTDWTTSNTLGSLSRF